MRRIVATFLVAIIASGFLLPVVMSAGEDSVPACCRRNGKHHCLMRVSAREGSARSLPRIHGPVSVCPYYDSIRPTRISAEAVPQGNIPDIPVIDSVVLSLPVPAHGLQFVDSALTRGPPVLS